MGYWQRRDFHRAGSISEEAMIHLDFVANELLREKVERVGRGLFADSALEARLGGLIGTGMTGLALTDQIAMCQTGPGNGRLPKNAGRPVELTLDRLLNKIKHRNPRLINFRIDAGRHIFLICPEHTVGGAEGIYEFDVEAFCRFCTEAAESL
jgi:hypothetical protein